MGQIAGAQLTTNDLPYYEDTESIVITRATQSGLSITTTTIYSGPADVQASSAEDFYDPSGVIQGVDAIAVIDPDANGALPTVLVEDIVTYNGLGYSVILAEIWTYPPAHLELRLKRGPQAYEAK